MTSAKAGKSLDHEVGKKKKSVEGIVPTVGIRFVCSEFLLLILSTKHTFSFHSFTSLYNLRVPKIYFVN